MIDKKAANNIKRAIGHEYQNIRIQHGEKYHSDHEGYSVLLKEVEEAKEELRGVDRMLKHVWKCVRFNRDSKNEYLRRVQLIAKAAAEEMVQVAAVAKKWEGL